MSSTKSISSVALSRTDILSYCRDYYQLTKPRVVALLVLTAWVGMMLAVPGMPDVGLVILASLGIALVSAAAAAFNQILDQKIDAQMARTNMRPLPNGKLTRQQAVIFACLLALVGFAILWFGVNQLTAVLTLLSLFGYSVVYTLLLKRATPQNIVIGGLAGAMPPLLGWAAMTGNLSGHAFLLVMIVFTWTPPHFWALAIHRRDDYAKANIPMLPVTHGIEFTKTAVLLYSLLLFVVCLLPYLVGMTGILYLLVSIYLNLMFIRYAWRLKYKPTPTIAMETFRFSIIHLMVLFLALLVDHYAKWSFIAA